MREFRVRERRLVGPGESDLSEFRDFRDTARGLFEEIERQLFAARNVIPDITHNHIAIFVAGHGLPIDVDRALERDALPIALGRQDETSIRMDRHDHRLVARVG